MVKQGGRSTLAMAVVFATAVLLGACSSSSSTSSSSAAGGGGTTVTMQGLAFHPDALTLPAGSATLTVTNEDSTLHSFTLDDDSVTQDVDPGATQTVTITVPASGTLGWHCRIHSSMTGTITVG
jgi:plastocyanin